MRKKKKRHGRTGRYEPRTGRRGVDQTDSEPGQTVGSHPRSATRDPTPETFPAASTATGRIGQGP